MNLLPETLVVCCSPVLPYGITELLQKLPPKCHILAVVQTHELFEFMLTQVPRDILEDERISYICAEGATSLAEWLYKKSYRFISNFRRYLKLNMSGCSLTETQLYDEMCFFLQDAISTYWKNRLTLMAFGKLFSKNLLQNTLLFPKSMQKELLEYEIQCDNKKIFVVGAGPSAVDSIDFLKKNRSQLFIICVDSSTNLLLDVEIIPDAILVVESQLANEKSFIGIRQKINDLKHIHSTPKVYSDEEIDGVILIADLNSRTSIVRMFRRVFFFISDFAHYAFINRIKEVTKISACIEPLGSVGVVALEIAKMLAGIGEPILFTGLDFSYNVGFTHCRNSQQHTRILAECDRFSPVGQCGASFGKGTSSTVGIANKTVRTDKILEQYASLCRHIIEKVHREEKNHFVDMRTQGLILDTSLQTENITNDDLEEKGRIALSVRIPKKFYVPLPNVINPYKWLFSEQSVLIKIRNVLQGSEKLSEGETLSDLLAEREYLYLHFPDGDNFDINDISFLKRLRSELNFFIKQLDLPRILQA